MKKVFLSILAIAFFAITSLNAQTEFWGLTSYGGEHGGGTVFKTDAQGDNHSVEHSFEFYDASHIMDGMIEGNDGKLYGLSSMGGAVITSGTIFQYDPVTNILIKKIDFTDVVDGAAPYGSLLLASNGKMYGGTNTGGANSKGVLFEYDPVANTYTKKIDFDGTNNGDILEGTLIEATNGKLYGFTYRGGANNAGVLFEYDITTNTLTKKIDFDGANNGKTPKGRLLEAANGKLYGVTNIGGANNLGTFFEYDITTNTLSKIIDFDGTTNGQSPYGGVIQAANGKLYGTTYTGGPNFNGVLFEYDITLDDFVVKQSLDGTNTGGSITGLLYEAINGKLYGQNTSGGANSKGVLFEYDITANTLTKKHDLNEDWHFGALIQASNGHIYGASGIDGATNDGVIFEYNISSDTYTTKLNLRTSEIGNRPQGNLVLADNGKFYGTTMEGGANKMGTLFEYDKTSDTYTKIVDFDGTDKGSNPKVALLKADNGKLYGVTYEGGANNLGVLFELDPSTNTFTKKIDFDGTNIGSKPMSKLMQASNGKLYSVTYQGGANNLGVLYEYEIAINTVTKLIDLDNTNNGKNPQNNDLVEAANGNLYGLITLGGANNMGVLYEYEIATNTFTKKIDFDGSAGGQIPECGLMQASNGKLYATANGVNQGVLFEYDIAGNTITNKVVFNGADRGRLPRAALLEGDDGKLYGTTSEGGASNLGVMFEYDFINDVYTKKIDFTGVNGHAPFYTQLIKVVTPIVNIPDANFKAYLVGNTAINTNGDDEIQESEANSFSDFINCASMNISDLTGIEAFTSLTQLNCRYNQLTSLNISNNTALTILMAGGNEITNLTIISNSRDNSNITYLECSGNLISSLDVSSLTLLTSLYCGYNANLSSLNVANGNNTNFTAFNALSSPALTCIEVDNATYSTDNWTNIDATASFSEDCGGVGIETNEQEKQLSIYPNPTTGQLSVISNQLSITNISIIDITGKTVKSINKNTNTVDVSDLQNGLYILKIQTENGTVQKRFIKK